MSGFHFKTEGFQSVKDGVRKPVTDVASKTVMLAAERHDIIKSTSVITRFRDNVSIPEEFSVIQRTNTYFGPKLHVKGNLGNDYLITAPGPDCNLLLWGENAAENGERESWFKLAELKAKLDSNSPQYHLCPQCNQPLKSADHERLAAIGKCPNI